MSKVSRFEDLVAWQKARLLAHDVYVLTRERAFARDFAPCDQVHKSAISVASNIAEGFERARRAEFRQFLSIAKASCAELRTQLYIAYDVGYIADDVLAITLKQAEEVGRVIGGLRASLERPLSTQHSALSTSRRCS